MWELRVTWSYPTSEVRGSGLECQAASAQEQWRGATLSPRSVVAGRSHLVPKARGGDPEESPQARGGKWEEPATPEPRASGWEEQP